METTTLSTKYQLVIPRGARTQLRLRPGIKFTVIVKGGVIVLVPERPVSALRGVGAGASLRDVRDKTERL